VRLTICGPRGSSPVSGPEFDRFGGRTPCVAVATGAAAPTLILDAGTGITRVADLLRGEPFRGSLLLTHLHWDHVQGLPFFRSGDHPDAAVTLLAPAQGNIAGVLERMMSPPFFPITPTELRGSWTFAGLEPGEHQVEGLAVRAAEVPHKGGRTFGYRVGDGARSFCYVSDHGPIAAGPGDDGLGERHPAIMSLVEGCDLLIHDAQYTREEFAARAHFGHSTADYAVGLALAAGARRLLLYHHDPAHDDAQLDAMLAHARQLARGSGLPVDAAAEGMSLEVGAPGG
jgi:phosphoribosyl 1,2-cyclic phosphodiesterase